MRTRRFGHLGLLLSGIAALSLYNQPPGTEGAPGVPPKPTDPPAPPPTDPPAPPPIAKTPEQLKAENLTAIKGALKLPENTKIDATVLERTAAIASELGLSPDHAPKILDLVLQEAATHADAQSTSAVAAALVAHQPGGTEYAKQQEKWQADALKDVDLGNGNPDQLKQKLELGRRVLAKFGDQQTVDWLEQTGLGSHPAALKLFARLGQAMREDTLVIPGATPPAAKDPAEIMYGATSPKS